jgi:hypothetical protein
MALSGWEPEGRPLPPAPAKGRVTAQLGFAATAGDGAVVVVRAQCRGGARWWPDLIAGLGIAGLAVARGP